MQGATSSGVTVSPHGEVVDIVTIEEVLHSPMPSDLVTLGIHHTSTNTNAHYNDKIQKKVDLEEP